MAWLKLVVAILSLLRPGLHSRSVHVQLVVDRVASEQIFLQ